MRPDIIHVGGVLYWTIQTRNPDTQVLKDADSTPTVAVRKNGSAVGDSVTITKRSATTGLYDCSYNPAAEVEGDTFQFEESATVTGTTTSSATYVNQFSVRAVHAGAVELDSAARVKLDASQPDYAPATAAALAAAKTILDKVDTGLVQDGAVYQFTANMLELGPSGGGGGDATLAKQEEILAALQGSEVIQVASPNVSGNLVLTQGDDYDGTANPKASWTVSTDYTDGWSVTLTIRDADDEVVYTTTGEVVSATVVAVTIAAPTGLTMTGCPGQWQGKFDVQLTKAGKKKTIALGVCYINEDQTR